MTTFLWWKKSLTEVQVILSALRNFKAPALFKELWTVGVGGGRATPYNDLCGRLLLKGVGKGFHLLTDMRGRGLSYQYVKRT